MTAQTLFPANSCGKPIAALAIAILEERGLLNINQRINEFIPAFKNYGKDQITILQVLTHQAGLVLPGLQALYEEWDDAEKI